VGIFTIKVWDGQGKYEEAQSSKPKAQNKTSNWGSAPVKYAPEKQNTKKVSRGKGQAGNTQQWALGQTSNVSHGLGRIGLNPEVMVGKPVIRGTRLTVDFMRFHLERTSVIRALPGLTPFGHLCVLTWCNQPLCAS